MSSRILIHNLGYPSMGARRELKKSIESFWQGKAPESELQETARTLRREHWLKQKQAGVDLIPSNDFSFYDRMLDTAALFGAVPERFGFHGGKVDLTAYFAMARGREGVAAMEMTKWFDTNYHYIVPELHAGQAFRVSTSKPLDEFKEAWALGIKTVPVLIGPVTFLKLGKPKDASSFDWLSLLDGLLEAYLSILEQLQEAGAEWVQVDEPVFSLDLTQEEKKKLVSAYSRIAQAVPKLKVMVANYFGRLDSNLDAFLELPVQALHLDALHSEAELTSLLKGFNGTQQLSMGVVNGRNIWKNDYARSVQLLEKALSPLGRDRVLISPSCSLLHVPVSLSFETKMDPELKAWLAFAEEKLSELSDLRGILDGNREALEKNQIQSQSRRSSEKIHDPAVKSRSASVAEKDLRRASPFAGRRKVQSGKLGLPPFPTTTIGSFPQTDEVRAQRALFRSGQLSQKDYNAFLEAETVKTLRKQEEIGLDVLVHGEFERTDMVEYFGEKLKGFTFTQNGWVQSYGSRCVKPPIIYGDVSRPEPMTVEWSSFARRNSKKPVKGMLTGPITILQWSFVRDDQPRSETAKQIALALRDEVADLEAAGVSIIQVDEPALREGLPLRRTDWPAYLRWAVDAFRLATAVVKDDTQVHTHMCYCEFNDIIESIAELDADVISIESSRSGMEILEAFQWFKYPNEVGPGVYDIHSPRVPSVGEMKELLQKALARLEPWQFWVNPDCGLKTRGWREVEEALVNMVKAAKELRQGSGAK